MVQLRPVPYCVFRDARVCEHLQPNQLILCLQPGESVHLAFGAKAPGTALAVDPVQMHFSFKETYAEAAPAPYERLLLDALRGDQLLFARADGVEAAWRALDPILEAWADSPPEDLPHYPAGSEGPPAAEALLDRDGQAWRRLGS